MDKKRSKWRSGIVEHGDQTGRTLGFPTVNFDTQLARDITQDGVYAATVVVNARTMLGALYVGPRLTLGETRRVLEIHLIDFDGDVYGKKLRFCIGRYIRPPLNFTSEAALKKQLANDIAAVRNTTV